MKLIKTNYGTPPGLNDFFTDSFLNWPAPGTESLRSKIPAVNIAENDNAWSLDLAVPGMRKEDFKIELDKNLLIISAEAKKENKEEQEKYTRREFSFTGFKRSFKLPENLVEGEKIQAKYENGVLSISLPKKEEAKPQPARMIEIA